MATWGLYAGTVCLDNALRREQECFAKIRTDQPKPLKEFTKDYYHWIVAKRNVNRCFHCKNEESLFGYYISWSELQSLLLHKELWPKKLKEYYAQNGLAERWVKYASEWEVLIKQMSIHDS